MVGRTATLVKLEHCTKILAAEFSSVPRARIAYEVETHSTRLLETANFDDFVPILTHRYVRDQLRDGALAPLLVEAA
jgi:hypothetical protein